MIKAIEQSGKTNGDLKRDLELIKGTAYHMNALISDLTDVVKIQAGRLSVERHECGLEEVVEPTIETLRPLAAEKHIELLQHLEPALPQISVDRLRMRQVLNNLLGNAVKFTSEG